MALWQDIDVEGICAQLRRWENCYKNNVMFPRLGVKEKKLLADNIRYKELHKGRRCFIAGNGPSINKMDFGSLEKELVITVNEMFRHQEFARLKSDFHFIADPDYLKLNARNMVDAETIEQMNRLSESDTPLFMPLHGEKIARHYGWHKRLDIHYFMSELFYYDNYQENMDFTKYIPCFQAVVQWGIAFAIYMGCSEIYLLGCDATNIVDDLSVFLPKETSLSYAYELSPDAAELEKKRRRKRGLEYSLYGYWRIVHLFSELACYCDRNGVKLYNCSQESILDSIPKRKIEDVL